MEESTDILYKEILRIQFLYNHYRKLYRKHRLFCCFGDASYMKVNKDRYKVELNKAHERLEAALFASH